MFSYLKKLCSSDHLLFQLLLKIFVDAVWSWTICFVEQWKTGGREVVMKIDMFTLLLSKQISCAVQLWSTFDFLGCVYEPVQVKVGTWRGRQREGFPQLYLQKEASVTQKKVLNYDVSASVATSRHGRLVAVPQDQTWQICPEQRVAGADLEAAYMNVCALCTQVCHCECVYADGTRSHHTRDTCMLPRSLPLPVTPMHGSPWLPFSARCF